MTKDFTNGVLSGGAVGVFTAMALLPANFGGDDVAATGRFNNRGR